MTARMDPALLPWSQEAEQSVLGGLLLDNSAFDRAQPLDARHFFDPGHALVWTAASSLIASHRAADVVTVFERLQSLGKADEAGGLAYLNALAASVPSAYHVGRYAEIVRDKALRRAIVEAATQAQDIATGAGQADEALDRVAALFGAIERTRTKAEPISLGDALMARRPHWESLADGSATPGIPTRLPTLDKALAGGLKPGTLVVLAARTSVGKTSLALQILLNLADQGHTVLMLSQEMSAGELVDRAVANLGSVGLGPLTTGGFRDGDWARVTEATEAALRLPVHVDDQPALTLLDIRAKARKVQQRHGLSLLVVDYLQLCAATGTNDKRHHQIEQISRGLKALSKELGITVLLLSQLNRASTQRSEPDLVDLKESGAIEEDADVAILLHPKGNLPDGSLLIAAIVAKNRQGRRCRVALSFAGSTQRWAESTADVSSRAPT